MEKITWTVILLGDFWTFGDADVTTDDTVGSRPPSPGGRATVRVDGGFRDPAEVEVGNSVRLADDWPIGDWNLSEIVERGESCTPENNTEKWIIKGHTDHSRVQSLEDVISIFTPIYALVWKYTYC